MTTCQNCGSPFFHNGKCDYCGVPPHEVPATNGLFTKAPSKAERLRELVQEDLVQWLNFGGTVEGFMDFAKSRSASDDYVDACRFVVGRFEAIDHQIRLSLEQTKERYRLRLISANEFGDAIGSITGSLFR